MRKRIVKALLLIPLLLAMVAFAGCGNDNEDLSDTDLNSVYGESELVKVHLPFNYPPDVLGEKDSFHFYKNRVLIVETKNNDSPHYLKTGKYVYTFDKAKQEITIDGITDSCVLSDSTMTISNFSYLDTGGLYIFKRKI